jgi:hypothetical protein
MFRTEPGDRHGRACRVRDTDAQRGQRAGKYDVKGRQIGAAWILNPKLRRVPELSRSTTTSAAHGQDLNFSADAAE